MERMIRIWAAACAAGMWMTVHAPAQAGAGAPAGTEAWAQELCAAIQEGAQLLRDNQLAPADGAARAALLEALIRASEPSVSFLSEEDLAARTRQLASRKWDAGLTLVASEDQPRVAAVRTGSPAAAAGILSGEWIEKIGGRDILSGAGLGYVRGLLEAGDDPALEIGIRAADGKSRLATVTREPQAESALTDVEELPAGMGYLRAAGVFPGTGAEIAAALEKWQSTELFGAILDLRGAAGTAADEVPLVAARFAPEGTWLYTLSDRQGAELARVQAPAAPVEALPLMVLVDEDTAGAAELLAAVLGGSVKGAMIIGRETAGDPLVREPKKLSTGRYALLATRQLTTADGTVYAGTNGVAPDVVITDTALDETVYEPEAPVLRKGKTLSDEEKEDKALRDRTRNDTYLRRAADVLLGLKALGYGRKP